MRPIAPQRKCVESHRSGAAKAVGGRRRIGDEAVHVGIDPAIGAVEAGALIVAGEQRSAQKIDAALEAPQIAAGARIGEVLGDPVVCLSLQSTIYVPKGPAAHPARFLCGLLIRLLNS
jgi:hypothetical protein